MKSGPVFKAYTPSPWLTALTSRAVLGGITSIIAGLYGFTAEETLELHQWLTNAAAVIGGALAIYGRVMAKIQIVRS